MMRALLLSMFALLAAALPARALDAPKGFETSNIVLYQPNEVLQARAGAVDDLANYVKQLQAACSTYFADADKPETLDVVVAVRPGKRARVWFVSSTRPGSDPQLEPLRKKLEALPPFDVHDGPVAFAIAAKIAGGDGTGPKGSKDFAPPIPKEWREAADGKEGIAVPDGLLDRVWPESSAATPQPGGTAAKPTVYLHVTEENDPHDKEARDTYASKFTVVDVKDSPAYANPKPTAGSLPGVARAASGEALAGYVFVEYIISTEGRATEPVVLKSTDKRLDPVALEAMRAWRFEPAKLNGTPIATTAGQEFIFKQP